MAGYSSFLWDETAFLGVFAKLDLKNVLVCRRVCKSWKEMIDLNLKFKTLIVHTDAYPCYSWSLDRKPLNPSESLKVQHLNRFLRSSLANCIFKNIQKLLLYCLQIGVGHRRFDLNSLNSFTELRQLEIFKFDHEYPRKSYKLNLQKLKFFKIINNEL